MAAVVTLLLPLLLDQAAEALTAHELAVKIQRAQHLSTRPHVTVRGFPFLTQVLDGKYTEIDVSSDSPVTNRGVTLSSVSVRLHGVHVGLTGCPARQRHSRPGGQTTAPGPRC